MRGHSRSINDADLHSFVDGQLSPARREAIAAALASNPLEMARVESWRRQNNALRSAFSKIASEAIPISLTVPSLSAGRSDWSPSASISLPGPPDRVLARKARDTRLRRASVALGAFLLGAAVALSTVVLTGYVSDPFGQRLPATNLGGDPNLMLLGRAFEAYRTYVSDPYQPVEVPAVQGAHLMDWLAKRTSLFLKAPDLRSEGLSFLGGRVVPGDSGPAALLVFADRVTNERTGLYIARTTAAATAVFHFQEGGSLNAVFWVDSGTGFALTAATGREILLKRALKLQRQLTASGG